MKKKPRKAKINLNNPREVELIPIVSDALIASRGIGGGRLIPLVILDTTERPDVDELVRLHQHLSPGDAGCLWGQRKGRKDKIALVVRFERPSRVLIIIEFDIARQGGFVDRILRSQGLYIQPGRRGDRLRSTMENPRLLVEIPDADFKRQWERMLRKQFAQRFRNEGLSRREAKQAVDRFLEEWRKLGSFRIK